MFRFYPYQMYSESLKKLIPLLNRPTLKVRADGRYRPRPNHIIINWGNTTIPRWGSQHIRLNPPQVVRIAVDKRLTFQVLRAAGVSHPEWTEDHNEALNWINAGDVVLCRRMVRGAGGAGISIARTVGELVPSPLYVKYKKKRKEFRIHVINEEVIDITEKRKRRNFNRPIDPMVRSWGNGWVFCHEDIVCPPQVVTEALGAVQALGLDFGAVDAIWNEREQRAYVLEVNTAPGIEGTTAAKYAAAFNLLR